MCVISSGNSLGNGFYSISRISHSHTKTSIFKHLVIIIGIAATACVLAFGTSNGGGVWFALIVLAPMMRAGLETLLLRFAYSRRIGRKGYWLLTLANAVCISVGIYALILDDHAHPSVATIRHY